MEDKNRRSVYFDDYFNSVFKQANTFTKEEFEKNCILFELNYETYLPKDKNCSILDIGSGTGQFLYFLIKKGYSNIEGVDISKTQVEYCREHVSNKVTCEDAFVFLKTKQNAYDLIVCNDVLEHIPKDEVINFLKIVHEALKPSGRFVVKCPNAGNPFSLNLRYRDFTHECGYTDSSLYQVFQLAGFGSINVTGSKSYFPFPKNILIRPVVGIFLCALRKLFWWQGYVAPKILAPSLICSAGRETEERSTIS